MTSDPERWAISRHYQNDSFPQPWSIGTKITIFEDRVRPWQLDIAGQLMSRDGHAGFAVLSIVVGYFEMIAKYEAGYVGDYDGKRMRGGDRNNFRSGVEYVFPGLLADREKTILYSDVRCELYHGGLTRPRITLNGTLADPIVQLPGGGLGINPLRLVERLQAHFSDYSARLRDPAASNDDLRKKFEKRFDAATGH